MRSRSFRPRPTYSDCARWTTCDFCGKKLYPSRKVARRAARAHHHAEHLATYVAICGSDGYHVGHSSPLARDKARQIREDPAA